MYNSCDLRENLTKVVTLPFIFILQNCSDFFFFYREIFFFFCTFFSLIDQSLDLERRYPPRLIIMILLLIGLIRFYVDMNIKWPISVKS